MVLLCSGGALTQASNSQISLASGRQDEQPIQLAVAAQPIAAALNDFARQSGLHVVIGSEVAHGVQSAAIEGMFTPEAALERLLTNTGLRYEYLDVQTVAVLKDEPAAQVTKSRDSLRLAQTDAPVADSGSAESKDDENLEEIVVTAQKRIERLQDVPVPVTAISAESLVNSNQLRLQDYFARIPGLNVTKGGFHDLLLNVRGLTTGGGNPTVGITVDDMQYGPSKGIALGQETPDIDPSELSRIEVLRGPQGTLYGASSLGGLLKYVTVDPSTEGFTGRVQAGTNSVKNGDELGYSVRAAVNVPLGDTFAIRASGFTRRDPGYIDNIVTGTEGVNETDVDGGRVSALWRPSEQVSLKLSALLQHSEVKGTAEVLRGSPLGDLTQQSAQGTGVYDKRIQAYTATAVGKLGQAELTSLTGYNISKFHDAVDFTPFFNPTFDPEGLANNNLGYGFPILDDFKTVKFSQELRLSMPIGERFDWLLGAFYTQEKTDTASQSIRVRDLLTGRLPAADDFINVIFPNAIVNHTAGPSKYEEYAAFTDLTVHFTDRFDVQFGGRQSHNNQEYQDLDVLAGTGGPVVRTDDSSFTFLVTPKFQISPDLMTYMRLASGYRPGGPNTNVALGALPQYEPDKTLNYEVGVKGNLLDRRLSFDVSVYYIDWKDIQLQLLSDDNRTSYYANGSRAKSQGVELSLESRPLRGLRVAGQVSWIDAKLTEDLPANSTAIGSSGDRLPLSSRISGSLSLDQEFPLGPTWTGFVGGTVSYVDERLGGFTTGSARQVLPSYTQTDLRAGAMHESWTMNLFLNNATDKRGILGEGFLPTGVYFIQPRTVGFSVARSF
jgi:outer membrane receptor protein involved in Fe transport